MGFSVLRAITLRGVTASGEDMEGCQVAADQCLFLGAGPVFELPFAPYSFGSGAMVLGIDDLADMKEASGSAPFATPVLPKTAREIVGLPHVQTAV